jgi:hypothetical protein
METIIDDESIMAAADAATTICHQEDLDRAIPESIAMVTTNESACGTAEVAGGPLLG